MLRVTPPSPRRAAALAATALCLPALGACAAAPAPTAAPPPAPASTGPSAGPVGVTAAWQPARAASVPGDLSRSGPCALLSADEVSRRADAPAGFATPTAGGCRFQVTRADPTPVVDVDARRLASRDEYNAERAAHGDASLGSPRVGDDGFYGALAPGSVWMVRRGTLYRVVIQAEGDLTPAQLRANARDLMALIAARLPGA